MNIIKKLFALATSILMVFTLSVPSFTNAAKPLFTDAEKADLREYFKNNPISIDPFIPDCPITRSILPMLDNHDSLTFQLHPNFKIKIFKLFAIYDYGRGKTSQEYLPRDCYYVDKDYRDRYTIFYTHELNNWISEKRKLIYEKDEDEDIAFFDIYLEAYDDTDEKFVPLSVKRVALYDHCGFRIPV